MLDILPGSLVFSGCPFAWQTTWRHQWYFAYFIVSCQDVFLNEVQLDANIAKNQALKENVFMMIVCVELRIPLFLVGKPGSSKSLAKTIVADAMQGKQARSDLFKSLKQVRNCYYFEYLNFQTCKSMIGLNDEICTDFLFMVYLSDDPCNYFLGSHGVLSMLSHSQHQMALWELSSSVPDYKRIKILKSLCLLLYWMKSVLLKIRRECL